MMEGGELTFILGEELVTGKPGARKQVLRGAIWGASIGRCLADRGLRGAVGHPYAVGGLRETEIEGGRV